MRNNKRLVKARTMMVRAYGNKMTKQIEEYVERYIFEKSSKKRMEICTELYDFLFYDNKLRPKFLFSSELTSHSGKRDSKRKSKEMQELDKMMEKAKIISTQIKKSIQKTSQEHDKQSKKKKQMEKKFDEIAKNRKKAKGLNEKIWKEHSRTKINKLRGKLLDVDSKRKKLIKQKN